MNVVLDTNIVVSGLIWGGLPRQLLDLGRDGKVTFFTSTQLLEELENVLSRSKFISKLATQNITPFHLF